MPVHLSIRNAPDHLVARVKRQAEQHSRSLRGELLDILDKAVPVEQNYLSVEEVFQAVRALGLTGPSESVSLVRADRDAR